MAVSTNLGLYLPTREDYISVSRDLSNNYEIIDKSAGMLEKGIAIVVDGDTAPRAISSGDYLFIKNHSSLATGGYHATVNIANGATVNSSNTAADSKGVANAIKADIDSLNDNITSMGKIKFLQTTTTTSVTLNLPSASAHFIIIGTNNRAIYAVLMAVVINNDAVQVTEISKGQSVTVDSSVTGKLTITFDVARQSGIYDMAIRGDNATM